MPTLKEFVDTQVGKKDFNMPEYQPKAVSRDLVPIERHKFGDEKKDITEHNFLRLDSWQPGPGNYLAHTTWYNGESLSSRPTFSKFTRVTIASDILKRGEKKEFSTPGP